MEIGVDIDEVAVGFVEKYLEYYNDKNNTWFGLDDIFSYKLWEVFGGTKQESVKSVENFYKSDFFDEIKPLDGAVDAVRELRSLHRISFVTARPEIFMEKTEKCISKYFGKEIPIVYVGSYYGGKSKGEIGFDLSLDIMLEDNYEYALSCVEKCITTYLFDKPWNARFNGVPNLFRVKDWNEISEILLRENNELNIVG